jgi:hypothetical protein
VSSTCLLSVGAPVAAIAIRCFATPRADVSYAPKNTYGTIVQETIQSAPDLYGAVSRVLTKGI